ncbi:hypothetical protein GQ55_5G122900 [Panicum hallii var. hallii]|uniref:Uncharacterized protein n=1 Tax=Panicum hallii var. hallii TaxID=1504633 RepID=A0A2T7DFG9_9POAL|nr:hypothetical protein GQ55_5G122900 [Panicum hallii var. hallii]
MRRRRPSPTRPPWLLPICRRRSGPLAARGSGPHPSRGPPPPQLRRFHSTPTRLLHLDTGGAAPELGHSSPNGVPRRCARVLLPLPVRTQELGRPSPTPRPPRLHPVRPSSASRQPLTCLDMPSPRGPVGDRGSAGNRAGRQFRPVNDFRAGAGTANQGSGRRRGSLPRPRPAPLPT